MTSAASRLAHVWQFRDMAPALLEVMAAATRVLTLESGTEIVTEGEHGDDAYVVLSGRVEVSVAGKNGPLPVAVMGENELFGELAILDAAGLRTATVVALTPLTVLRIDGRVFARAIEGEPALRRELESASARMAVARFIKSATVLGELPPDTLAAIASHVQTRTIGAGEIVVRQGEPGSECFLVRSGELDVFDEHDGEERQLATLRAGTLFGEAALLTGAPRNATVRTRTVTDVLVLEREDVLRAMSAPGTVATHLVALLQARSRPKQRAGVELHERATADGDVISTLRDPVHHTYFRLSRDGAFVWKHLDGEHTIRDLTMDLFTEYKVLAPDIVMEIVRQLAASNMIDLEHLDANVAAEIGQRDRFARAFRSTMEWSFSVEGCDRYFSAVYARGAKLLFTPVGAIVAAMIATVGFLAFIAMAQRSAGALLHGATFAKAGVALFPLMFLAVVLHELGHGMAAKAAGAHVDRIGIGWYWFRPIVFVDTSDAWLANRRMRMLVDASGIIVNLVLAGIAGGVSFLTSDATVAAVAWVFALWSYVAVVRNLNPLLEYDGYYLLMDWLEVPNLRAKSLAWLGHAFPAAIRDPARLRRHRLELWYGIGSVAYIVVMTWWLMFAYRFTVQGWVQRVIPPGAAGLVSQLLVLTIGGLAFYRLADDIRKERASARTRHARDAQTAP